MHNRVITAIGNNSASNDHNQHKHDMNSKLIEAAGKFASGKNLGLSEEETLALMSRELRRQQRADQNVTPADIARQFAQSGNSLADVSAAAELDGAGYENIPEVDPFGQDQSQYYEYGPEDSQYEQQQLEKMQEQMLDMEDRTEGSRAYPEGRQRRDKRGQVILKSGESPEDYEELGRDTSEIIDKRKRETLSSTAPFKDMLAQLQAAKEKQAGLQGKLSGVFGGGYDPGTADLEGRLEDSINLGPNQRRADAALSAEMASRDRDRASSRRAAYNNIKAQIEAEEIGETMYRPSSIFPSAELPAVRADQALAAIGRANAAPGPAAFNSQGIPLDPRTGNPLAIQGPEYITPNTDTGSTLNAPMTSRAWAVERQPSIYREGGRPMPDPQTDITGATTLFADRLRQLEGFGNVSSNVRSIDELQRAVDAVISKGGNFTTREPVTDASGRTTLKSVRQAEPDIRGVLNKLRYTPAQEAQLANAMYQMDVAAGTTINQQGKQQYFTRTGPGGKLQPTQMGSMTTPGGASVIFDAPEAINPIEGQAAVERVRPGQTIEGRDIGTAFRGLSTPGARQPFIGQVEGEKPRINRYNTTGETDPVAIESALRKKEEGFQVARAKKSRGRIEPVDEKGLRGKVVKAQLTEERAKRDDKKRQAREREVSRYTMANPSNIGRVVPARRRI